MKLSENFSLSEFDCHDGTAVPDEYIENVRDLAIHVLQPIRDHIGGQIEVISGWRSPDYNFRIGGAKRSTHMTAKGADIATLIPAHALHGIILGMWQRKELPRLGGLGIYPGWVHVDTLKAADGHLRRWAGSGVGSEAT